MAAGLLHIIIGSVVIAGSMEYPKKSLGQHWLKDENILESIADDASISGSDTVLEIGPGLGNLTKYLVKRSKKVVAIELDEVLAAKLLHNIQSDNLEVIPADILKFDLTNLPASYKVVANIPYYLTSNLLRILCESSNPPSTMTLLVQKEVAERICAGPGKMSVLAVSVQLYYKCNPGMVVPAKAFMPPPKVDSQVVFMDKRTEPLFKDLDSQKYFQIVRAGFSERRKKLRSSLSGGLRITKDAADKLLKK